MGRKLLVCDNPFGHHKKDMKHNTVRRIYPTALKRAQSQLTGDILRDGFQGWTSDIALCIGCRAKISQYAREVEGVRGGSGSDEGEEDGADGDGGQGILDEQTAEEEIFIKQEPIEEEEEDLDLDVDLDLERFAIIPSPPPPLKEESIKDTFTEEGRALRLSYCLICGNRRIVRASKNMKNGTVGDYLCKLLGLSRSTYAAWLASGPYCRPCEDYGDKVIKMLNKLEEIERQIEEMKEKVKRKMAQALKEEEDPGGKGTRHKMAKDLGLPITPVSITKYSSDDEHERQSIMENTNEDYEYDTEGNGMIGNNLEDVEENESESLSQAPNPGPYSLRRRRKVQTSTGEDADNEDDNGQDEGDPDYDFEKEFGKKARISMGIDAAPPSFPCPICRTISRSEMAMRAHVLQRHEGCDTPWHCQYPGCSRQFKEPRQLQIHEERHQGPGYICPYCGKTYRDCKGLQRHEARFHLDGGNLFKCDECKVRASTEKLITTHKEKFHSGPFKCDQCGKGLHSEAFLQEHVKRRHSLTLKCSDCDKTFCNKSTLMQHKKEVHNKEFDCECNICGEKIISMHALRLHMGRFHKEKKFQCQICQRKFSRIALLNRHSKIHTQQYTVHCQLCGKGFFSRGNMRKHHFIVHVEGRRAVTKKRKHIIIPAVVNPAEEIALPNTSTVPPPPEVPSSAIIPPAEQSECSNNQFLSL